MTTILLKSLLIYLQVQSSYCGGNIPVYFLSLIFWYFIFLTDARKMEMDLEECDYLLKYAGNVGSCFTLFVHYPSLSLLCQLRIIILDTDYVCYVLLCD